MKKKQQNVSPVIPCFTNLQYTAECFKILSSCTSAKSYQIKIFKHF